MFLAPYLAGILLIGGWIAWGLGAEVRDILYVCAWIAVVCVYLFMMGCVYCIVYLWATPLWAVATPIILTALLGLAFWNRYR